MKWKVNVYTSTDVEEEVITSIHRIKKLHIENEQQEI